MFLILALIAVAVLVAIWCACRAWRIADEALLAGYSVSCEQMTAQRRRENLL